MKKMIVVLCVVLFLFIHCGLSSVTPATEPASRHHFPEPQTIIPISEQLNMPFSHNIKEQITLTAALKQINSQTGISVIIDHGELQGSGVDWEKKINFYLPFKILLSDFLDYLTKQQNLAWIVQNDDYILITSKKYAEKYEKILNYYVGDLLAMEAEGNVQETDAAAFQSIIDYITVMIDSETWNGNIQAFHPNLSLVVHQPINVHKQITELLQQLREAKTKK
ncbi:MAG: hypothetical protein LBP87_03935 [Planctomycetaceae bacterium]|jgi:hypothetical protein|nr:hypothetical protein [Planctomycetaceae bacterium]